MSRWIRQHSGGARRLTPLAVFAVLALSTGTALAWWTTAGTSSGSGSAQSGTMPAGLAPTVAPDGLTDVTVSIPQVQFYGQPLGELAASGYTVQRRPSGGGAAVTPSADCDARISGAAATLQCTEQAVPSGSWVYSVTPVMRTWTGAESPTSNVIVVTPKPEAPTGFTASAQPGGSIDLAWGAVSGVDGYVVYRTMHGNPFDYDTPLSGASLVSGTSWTDSTAIEGVTYDYVVRAALEDGADWFESDDSNTATATPDATPPSNITLAAIGTPTRGTLALSGTATDATSGVDNVLVRYRVSPSGTWTTGCVDSAPGGGTYSCSLNTVAAGLNGTYDFQAVAADAVGNTASSAVRSAVVVDNVAPSVGSIAAAAVHIDPAATLAITGATATDALSGLDSVIVQYKLVGGSTWATACTPSAGACSVNTTAWTNGTAYNLRIFATDNAGNTTAGTPIESFVSRNILTNPGFESNPAGTDWSCGRWKNFAPTGWESGTLCGYDNDGNFSHSGTGNSWVNVLGGGGGYWMTTYRPVTTVNGQWYCVAAWMRTAAVFAGKTGSYFGLRPTTSTHNAAGLPGEVNFKDLTNYTQLGAKIQADRATGLELYVGTWSETNGWAQSDDWMMRPIPSSASGCPGA